MKLRLFAIFLIILSPLLWRGAGGEVFAQNRNIDSLLTLLKKPTTNDTIKLHILVSLSEECDEQDILKYAKPAVELANKLLSVIPSEVDEQNKPSTPLRLTINKQKALALNNIGYICNRQGQIKEALDYYHYSLKIQEEINDKTGIAASLINIGFIYNNQGNATQALDYYQKSLKIQQEIKDNYGISYSLNNIGAIYEKQGDVKQALDYNLKALKMAEELGNKQLQANTLGNIGTSYYKQGQLKVSLTYYSRSLKIRKEI
ncbi:MAG TPA: tetratricopeptide repeat protein, partial [Bacteroidia bacterium]